MFRISHSGDFKNLEKFLERTKKNKLEAMLSKYGNRGVEALQMATPKDSGNTASSWTYEVENTSQGITLYWINTNVNKGVNIAVLIQNGHGTRNGGYVVGRDYINPAMRPVFDKIASDLWKEVVNS